MPISQEIGYIKANNTSPQNKIVTYHLESCQVFSNDNLGSVLLINKSCNVFKIDPTTGMFIGYMTFFSYLTVTFIFLNLGVIATNSSYYAPYSNSHFVLRVSASNGKSIMLSDNLFVYYSDYGERARFQLSRTPVQPLPSFFRDLKQ